jgi:hypothetical protein
MRILIWALGAVAIIGATPAFAENQVLKCHVGVARRAPVVGDTLTANVARSMTPVALDSVQFTDKKLAKSMIVEGIYTRRTETNTVEVMARLVNCTKKPLQVKARASFLDAQQFPTESPSQWRTVFLPPRGFGLFTEKSIGKVDVANFLIEMSPN